MHTGPRRLPDSTDILIVGAGPVGLVLACSLAARGVRYVLVDRLAEAENTSRAAVVHARSLEVLEPLGVTERFLAEGIRVPHFLIRDRDRVLARIRFDRLPTRYAHTLMLPQDRSEAILLQRLRELGGDVHRPYVVEDVRQDNDGVTVAISGDGQPARAIRARYVVGADGMHSVVREHAGIGFVGERYEESFVLADVRIRWSARADEVFLFLSPNGLVVVAPLPGGRHRIVATMNDAPEHPGLADIQRLLDARGPLGEPARVDAVVWSSRFRVHHRLAERYRSGRIVLAGDAAHVHSPAGGQGMNTGIQDAIALGRTLGDVVADGAPNGRLDDYERTRRPIAERVIAFTHAMTRMATLRGRAPRAVRNLALSVISRTTPAPNWIAAELAGLHHA